MNRNEIQEATIFVVEDDPTNLSVLFDYLTTMGFKVLAAQSGESALRKIAYARPDIILLDVILPGIDGFETCRRLKMDGATKDIPVIFITSLTEGVDKVRGFDVGGVDYITKPHHFGEMFARLNAHLIIRKQQKQLQEQNTRLQEQNTLVEQQREQLRELNRNKDKFFSIIAHDLKNPLIGFLSFVKLIEEDLENWNKDQIQKLLGQLRDSAENLSALIENLLTWSRIQRDMIDYLLQPIDLRLLIARNIEILTPNAEQKQVTFQNSLQEEISVDVDLHMLDTVVRNLLSNAIKFTEVGGTIKISATHDENTVNVAVSDTGIGIPEEKLSDLFRIDAKSQREGTAGEKGTGLGLILCKEFIEKHGGKIWAESKVGKGTTFTFTLPRKSME
jgi:signal transduction histidine kinase